MPAWVCPRDVKTQVQRYVEDRHWSHWAVQKTFMSFRTVLGLSQLRLLRARSCGQVSIRRRSDRRKPMTRLRKNNKTALVGRKEVNCQLCLNTCAEVRRLYECEDGRMSRMRSMKRSVSMKEQLS